MISLHDLTLVSILLWLLPDILMLVSSIIFFIVLKKLTAPVVNEDVGESGTSSANTSPEPVTEEEGSYSPEQYVLLKRTAIFCAMAMLLFAATLQPSVPSAVYFLVFLSAVTIWAYYGEIGRGFAIICRILGALLIVHVCALLVYQTPWPQQYLDVNNTVIRLLGFSPLIVSSCNSTTGDIRVIYLNQMLDLDAFLNPVALLLCYYALIISSGFILDAKDLFDSSDEPNERTPLMRRSMKRLKTFKQIRPTEGPSLSDPNAIPLESIGEEETQATIGEHITFAIGHLSTVICKHSYVISNIMMMVWSIVYHSWLTFVFLLVANLLWIIPNQRKNMHRISKFVVGYAIFLLISQYLYCMNLTDDELPTKVDIKGINLEQIGFIRYRTYPCVPLLLKTLFTITFWLTYRQMKYEDTLQRRSSTLAHLAAPFQVTVSAATTDLGPKPESKKSKIMMKAGNIFKTVLMQVWIWIVVFALFFFAIYGKDMTVFRIVYMALFLIFMVTFQLSWRIWKKMMYVFWIFVIGFSMLSLTMIYTYQFDRFDEFWEKYIGIDKDLQRDIGLVKYETKILFLRLFYPTLLVVITVVQLQMFHKKYLAQLDLPSLTTRRESSVSGIQPSSSVNYGSLEAESPSEEHQKTKSHYARINVSDLKNLNTKQAIKKAVLFYNRTKWFFDIFWLFMELHFIKVILLLAFYLGINEVSTVHIAIIVLTVIAVTSRTNTQTIYSGFISLTVAILFILKMIYQIEYIPQSFYDVNCPDDQNLTDSNMYTNDSTTTTAFATATSETSTPIMAPTTTATTAAGNTTFVVNNPNNNTANWVGFNKLVHGQTLMQLLSGYIVYIVALTIYNLILLHQQRKRFLSGKSIARPKVLFPRITRNDADKDISHLIKYLFNFAFYKFGVEVTLLMLAILIGARMDIVAVLYAVWLCILFGVSRETKHRIWPIFQSFIVILIVVQYITAVNLPPFICFNYPWKTNTLKRLQEIMWLPDPALRTDAHRLVLDFLLLICTCRQMLVFRIEKQYENSEFPGGSNKSVVEKINKLGSGEVPIEMDDFVSIQKNWLDILKCIVFLGWFWITLAIVFLAGSSHPNIYSIGYLIGSFIFLWQGGEFYLRPIHTILRWWKFLVAYNVLVIIVKAMLHLPVCIFIDELELWSKNTCLFEKAFGINCPQGLPRDKLPPTQICDNPDDSSLAWDIVCFLFLIFQLRIFQSYYFCHIINESKASTILASRGAELIESLRKKQVKIQAQREEEILQKIKVKMDRIKANQQKMQPALTSPKTHYQEGALAPLARTISMSSCAGYHTPIEDEVAADGICDLPSDLMPTSRGGSMLNTQVPSPSSAIMTVSHSLDAYLEPTRLSFSSPPVSELMQQNSDDSYPVFSPLHQSRKQSLQSNILPVGVPMNVPTTTSSTQNTLQPGTFVRQHRRQSSVNTVSWTDQGDATIGKLRRLSTTLNPSNETDEEEVMLRRKHRRQSSVGLSIRSEGRERRRSSYTSTSWIRDADDEADESTRTGRSRPCSWGPIGEIFYRDSLSFCDSERSKCSPLSHHESVRSGDYYLFEDLDEKVELDLLHERPSAGIDDAITDRKLSDKLTIEQVITKSFQTPPNRHKRQSDTSGDEETDHHATSLPTQPSEKVVAEVKSTISEPIKLADTKSAGSEFASATVKDEFTQPDGEQPSTSRSLDDEPDDLSEPLSSTGSERPAVSSAFTFIKAFISGILVSMTLRLYKLSRNYRYVTRVLSKEKKALKLEKDFGQGHRIGAGRVWAPLPSVLRTQGQSTPSKTNLQSSQSTLSYHSTQQSGNDSEEYLSDNGNEEQTPQKGTTIAHLLKPQLFPTKEQLQPADDVILKDFSEGDDDFYSQRHSILTEFFQSLWFALISNTDLVCYLLVFINMVHSQSILALPMPLMVFLWGTLTVPRPSKTFWISLIAYTQVVVLIKCIAPLFLWFDKLSIAIPENNPMAPPRIIGVEVKPNYATYDLILLLVVFFHRFVQKQMGIWKSGFSDEDYAVQPIDPSTIQATVVDERVDASNQNVAVVPKPEVDENGERDKLVQFEKTPEESSYGQNYFSNVSAISKTKYCSPFTNFFRRLLKMTNRVSADVYTYIFLCDFINFFVLLFGFTAFGSSQGDGGVTSYLQENKIPIAFLIMLLLQFVFIIVDRALYLRKNLLGKIIFQYISVILMHIWLFFLVPILSERSFNTKLPPIMYYGFKYMYFLLSAYQIRCGYPRRILGNCLTKGFTMFNLFAFKIYMMTPFLFELRTLMDWIWTESTMPLFEWLKMEDIFANIFELKCSRQMEKDFPAPRGQSKGSFVKYLMGGGFLIAIIGLVWGPLALFALGNTVGEANSPTEVRVELRIGPYEPVYSMSAQSSQIHPFDEQSYEAFKNVYYEQKDRSALTFLSNYDANDLSAIVLGPNSTSLWIISPPDLQRLKDDLMNNVTLKVQYKYFVSRKTNNDKLADTISRERSFDLKSDTPARKDLLNMLNKISNQKRTQLPFLFPKFLKVKNPDALKPATQLISSLSDEDHYYRNLTLFLHQNPDTKNNESDEKYWEVLEECDDKDYENKFSKLPYAECKKSSVMYTFSDKLFPTSLSWLTAGGVIGIYTTFVFVASRFFRGLFSGSSFNIMYSELPFVDRILQLCLDIYLVRESLEFSLEEDLFAKLIFLYRSPEVMIRWTRPAEEQSTDDDEDESDIDETQAEKVLRKAPSRSLYK
ncbi:piezo-type mechanosensitive ion channel component isoform X2 [Contarinia nasturtii]|uniref:piezo-type mechanosensitive ion channel component isoform X2 n=1 Tax=Contarinia nasturtii TaxID=265458 RepID=UPI0012D3D779|nr:piezo-type mechanosensitive ion channel component isoform X2 [Contarinia nasturtii]